MLMLIRGITHVIKVLFMACFCVVVHVSGIRRAVGEGWFDSIVETLFRGGLRAKA